MQFAPKKESDEIVWETVSYIDLDKRVSSNNYCLRCLTYGTIQETSENNFF